MVSQSTIMHSAQYSGNKKLAGLLYNQDCTDFFYSNAIKADIDGGAVLDRYFDIPADAGVTVLLINTNARKTNYRSSVWESFWEGYAPEGPDSQPFFKGVPPADLPAYRRMMHGMMVLDQQGVDYAARIIARCRLRGISPWISLRMNDVHYNDNLDSSFHGRLWRDPQYFRGGSGYFARGLDYAHAAVRDLYRALIVETLQRYDSDGLELDFMREPYLFRIGAEAEGAKILQAWLHEIRLLVDDARARRGHPIRIGVRVPSHIEVAQSWGLDAVAWAKEGLVDLVVAAPRWATLEYDMPLGKWAQALAGTGVTLAGGLEINHQPLQDGPTTIITKEQATGAAAAVLSDGADIVYLFNYFLTRIDQTEWTAEGYHRTLRAMCSLKALNGLPRRHAITWRDIIGKDEQYRAPLPAEGTILAFALPTGLKPPAGARVSLELRLAQPVAAAAPTVTVNRARCKYRVGKPDGDGVAIVTYDVPASALPGNQRDSVEITAPGNTPVKVLGLEICIEPKH